MKELFVYNKIKMEHYLAITTLNDFIFCPYSIYLHQIYKKSNENVYHSKFQSKGKRLHNFIDNNQDKNSWKHAFVYSNKLKIYGKIDDYNPASKELIEYKSTIAIAFKGYYYQIWAQYLCLLEMNVTVKKIAFYDFNKQEKIPLEIPSEENIKELKNHILKVQFYNFNSPINVNPNKCKHCIYHNLCEKAIFLN